MILHNTANLSQKQSILTIHNNKRHPERKVMHIMGSLSLDLEMTTNK